MRIAVAKETREGEARVAMPGGDDFGSRPIDLHLTGLEALGATFELSHGTIHGRADQLVGGRVLLEYPSVGATENVLLAATLAKGTTVIDNAAREPEIVDICRMLTGMGAHIGGAGSSKIEIEGVTDLRPVVHRTIGDRIVAGTWAFGAAMTRGDVTVSGVDPGFLEIAVAMAVILGMLGFVPR